jgi:predicted nucleotidyltransferase
MKSFSEKKQTHRLKQQIAVEAARIMNEEGIDSFFNARKKAAHSLGVHDKYALPDEKEILFQLRTYQSLYQSSTHKQSLKDLRETALKAMQLFKSFKPKLIGSVLHGYAHEHSRIKILIRADSAEEIAVFLMTNKIPYQLQEWELFFDKPNSKIKNSAQPVPVYQFYAGKYNINIIILSENQRHRVPLDPDNWQTIKSASIAQVEALIDEDS